MSAVINTFPAAHTFSSPRSWAMAIIVLIHLGFFWALTSGLQRSITFFPPLETRVVNIEPKVTPPDPARIDEPVVDRTTFVPSVDRPQTPTIDDDTAPRSLTHDETVQTVPVAGTEPIPPLPVEISPEIDPRRGLSEPLYPASLIREGVEGTVILSVKVLENGRVGEVRIDQSSGNRRLDESAMNEARRWRLIPGTRDGVPVALWKQIPVTFRIEQTRR